MSMNLEPILKHLSTIVQVLPPSVVKNLVVELTGKRGEKLRGRLGTLAATTSSRSLFEDLDRLWSELPEIDAVSLGIALKTAQLTFMHSSGDQNVNIVWTGPATDAVPVRRTEQVLREIIEGAKLELLVVSFVVYKVEEIMRALRNAQLRGVRVRMVLEDEEKSGGKISFDQVRKIREELSEIQLFVWPLEKRIIDSNGQYGSLHAKCAVADREVALISSANLTGFALDLNMELGLVLRGNRIVKSIAEHFDELIRRKILVKLET